MRTWRVGDRVDLTLPRRLRLEPIDPQHPDTVALLCGPLVLLPVIEQAKPLRPRRAELLGARQVAKQRWQTRVGSGPVTLLPYVEIDEEPYSTVVTLAR